MRKLFYIVFALILLTACTQDLPPAPGLPGGGTVGQAGGAWWSTEYSVPSTFSITPSQLTFTVSSIEKNISAMVTGDQYVYSIGYLLDTTTIPPTWKPFTFDQPTYGNSLWIQGNVDTVLKINLSDITFRADKTQDLYAIAYACSKLDNVWQCHDMRWMIKNFTARILSPPEVPTGFSANLFGNTITLSWTAVPGVTYDVYNSTTAMDTPYTKLNTAPITTNYFVHSNLVPGTAYYYKMKAVNPAGESGFAGINYAVASTPRVPLAPTNLIATTVSTSQIDLSWNPVTGATGYNVYNSTASPYTKLTSVPLTITTYSHSGLPASLTDYYVVRAVNDVGESSDSNTATGTTLPAVPTGLEATAVSDVVINLQWDSAVPLVRNRIYRSSDGITYAQIGGDITSSLTLPHISYSDSSGLAPNTKYYYEVSALNSGLVESEKSDAVEITTHPAPPTNLVTTTVSTTEVNLNWDLVQDMTYNVYRSSSSAGPYVKIAGPLTAPSYSDASLTPSSVYYYGVTVVSAYGESPYAYLPGYTKTEMPTGLTATAISSSEIDLSWNAVAMPGSLYTIYMLAQDGTYGVLGGSVSVPGTTYPVTGLRSSTAYSFKVTANRYGQESDLSNEATATTLSS